jgi:hypothetical protein
MKTKIVLFDKIDFSVKTENQENDRSNLARSNGDRKPIFWAMYCSDKENSIKKNFFIKKRGGTLERPRPSTLKVFVTVRTHNGMSIFEKRNIAFCTVLDALSFDIKHWNKTMFL